MGRWEVYLNGSMGDVMEIAYYFVPSGMWRFYNNWCWSFLELGDNRCSPYGGILYLRCLSCAIWNKVYSFILYLMCDLCYNVSNVSQEWSPIGVLLLCCGRWEIYNLPIDLGRCHGNWKAFDMVNSNLNGIYFCHHFSFHIT